jgi:hypothetical protein
VTPDLYPAPGYIIGPGLIAKGLHQTQINIGVERHLPYQRREQRSKSEYEQKRHSILLL